MNATERAKATALKDCRLGPSRWAQSFVQAMAWMAMHEPETTLTPTQKWSLDVCVYRYRRQLAGHEDFEIPAQAPERSAYIEAHKQRCAHRQASREAREGVQPTQESLF